MSTVAAFERAFADYVGAKHGIALCNGTATLHTALAALGIARAEVESQEMDGSVFVDEPRVAVPPLTMSATTIAVLHAGGIPVFVDVDPDTWLMEIGAPEIPVQMPVDLYGLRSPQNDWRDGGRMDGRRAFVKDSAQTLRPHGTNRSGWPEFTSYSFQSSKILPLGEGGMLVTNEDELAIRAREFSSLGYRMGTGPTIDKRRLKDPAYERHHSLGWNYRMSEHVAAKGLEFFKPCGEMYGNPLDTELVIDMVKRARVKAAHLYRDALDGCGWATPQHVPEGWAHDYWAYAVALGHADLWRPLADAIERHGGARPFAAWRLTYQEPAFRHLAEDGCCPVAEDLQPRIMAFQTNDLKAAERNAAALHVAWHELNGVPA